MQKMRVCHVRVSPLRYEWLVNDLKAADANRELVPWVVFTGHRPMFVKYVIARKTILFLQNCVADTFLALAHSFTTHSLSSLFFLLSSFFLSLSLSCFFFGDGSNRYCSDKNEQNQHWPGAHLQTTIEPLMLQYHVDLYVWLVILAKERRRRKRMGNCMKEDSEIAK